MLGHRPITDPFTGPTTGQAVPAGAAPQNRRWQDTRMGEGFYFFDILIFGMVAAFLVYRLRSVLGRRHGEERQRPNPFTPPPKAGQAPAPAESDNVVPLPDRGRPPEAPLPVETGPISLEEGLRQIRAADPTFNEKHFLQGAKAAFEMIVKAFADGDTPTLRPLLADDVYDGFAEAIRKRQAAGETRETRITAFESVDLKEARMDGRHAMVTIRFITHQVDCTVNAAGDVVDGDPDEAIEVVDIWTFSRNTRSPDPNWLLVETREIGRAHV